MKNLSWIFTLLIGTASSASAFEGKGLNPGDWKMLPASLETVNGQWNLRLRNLDLFPKYCSLRVTMKGEKVLGDDAVLFKADRSLSLPLGVAADASLKLSDLETHMACIKLAEGEALDKLPDPGKLSCELGREDCEHICKADAENKDLCANDHLWLEFSRSSLKVEESTESLTAAVQLKSHATETLTCQALITARIVGGAPGDVSAVIASTESFVLEPAQTHPAQWTFEKSEAGVGRHFDVSRPRVAAVCSPGKLEKAANWYKSCHPLKRSECNYLVVKD